MSHPAFTASSVAVITGGASGIGKAVAERCASMGMRVVIVDRRAELLGPAADALRAAGAADVLTSAMDVTDRAAWQALEADVSARFGGANVLMNNAGIGRNSSCLGALEDWTATLDVNLMGAVHGCQVFGPGMVKSARPCAIINTGSKQGITAPPGNPAYNTSKAALKAFTEALAHELRNTDGSLTSAHLMIPGFVFSDMTRGDRTEKPAAAWTPEQAADFMLQSLDRGDFYILCPDNDVARATDEKRMAWAMGDIIENRPALSRWHPDWAERFADYMADS